MSNPEVICPWIVPRAPKSLLELFDSEGQSQDYSVRAYIQTEAEQSTLVRRIDSGLVSQGVTNYRLNKPLAMNLYPDGSFQGFLNLFSSEPTPRLVRAVKPSRITSLPGKVFRERLMDDKGRFLEYVGYTELAGKSELIGMEALFSLSLPERFLLFWAATLFHSGVNPLESREEYLELPMQVSRATLSNIIYTTKAPLDRLLSAAAKEGTLICPEGSSLIRRKDILMMSEWILSR